MEQIIKQKLEEVYPLIKSSPHKAVISQLIDFYSHNFTSESVSWRDLSGQEKSSLYKMMRSIENGFKSISYNTFREHVVKQNHEHFWHNNKILHNAEDILFKKVEEQMSDEDIDKINDFRLSNQSIEFYAYYNREKLKHGFKNIMYELTRNSISQDFMNNKLFMNYVKLINEQAEEAKTYFFNNLITNK